MLRRQKYEGRRQKESLRINARDLINLLRIYFPPYLKAGALDRMAEHRGLTLVSKFTIFPSALCPLPSAFLR
jgi:hypothetical protein